MGIQGGEAMSKYTTGEMAKLCNVSVRTVQYYDTRDILIPSEITDGGRRVYSDADLNKLKTICQLRDLGMSINNIARILEEKNNEKVIALIFSQQEKLLRAEIEERNTQLKKLEELRKHLAVAPTPTNSNDDVAHNTMRKKTMKNVIVPMLIVGIPLGILQWTSIILWITNGLWWLFAIWAVLDIPAVIILSKYYYKHVAFVCPECEKAFKPKLKEMFWAYHTPRTRKLVCPHCNKKSMCLEIYDENG